MSDSDSGSDREDGRSVKRRKTGAVVNASSATQKSKYEVEGATKYAADTSATIADSNDATKQSNWTDEDPGTDGTYKGQKNYSNFIQKNPDGPKVGPVKPTNTNVRMVTLIDYAPDVCKDYKQTGFCGFGDSCKFLHAREDYAAGWKLDREWEINTKGKKTAGTVVASANRDSKTDDGEDEEEAKMLEKIPFACIICKKPYTQPVITNCGHYFCEKCALQRFRKNPSCAACGAGTGGRFNEAKNLKKLLEKKRDRDNRKKEKLREEGQEVSDNEDKD
ncbi:putative pre-mrna-splicing factor cwc24 [Diplodia seriata]|uniref:Pre-mRNA-splicing factor CWC24 n=1 Tax=Diplodia seriata TaxID=420778 RepID=A0A0G2EKN4_9PEZI|nr:putative pre-mrna-splicing factor cwc24 [Diplodia seriata]